MTVEKDFIKNIDKLIPRPEIALEVITIANEAECNIPRLSGKIKQDPSLMANMLKLANSAYFGHMKEIKSITDIVVRLGLDTIKMLAITSASVGILKTPQEAYNLEPGSLWRHSYATALLSSIIGRHAKSKAISSLYTAALLHDLGKIILNRPLQVESMNRSDIERGKDIIEFEQALLHTNHAKVGQVLLQEWGLPDVITKPVGKHHKLSANELNCRIIYLANQLTESIGIQSSDPDDCLYQVESCAGHESTPDVPGFHENMESIVSEFFDNFNDCDTLQFD